MTTAFDIPKDPAGIVRRSPLGEIVLSDRVLASALGDLSHETGAFQKYGQCRYSGGRIRGGPGPSPSDILTMTRGIDHGANSTPPGAGKCTHVNRLDPEDRNMLNDDLSRLRDYRAHHADWR